MKSIIIAALLLPSLSFGGVNFMGLRDQFMSKLSAELHCESPVKTQVDFYTEKYTYACKNKVIMEARREFGDQTKRDQGIRFEIFGVDSKEAPKVAEVVRAVCVENRCKQIPRGKDDPAGDESWLCENGINIWQNTASLSVWLR